jgi:hypothetical protein
LILWRYVLLALAEGDASRARELAEEMERALRAVSALVPEHRIMAQFDLAKFWSRQGTADRAFGFWVEGHRLLGQFQPFSREAHRRFVEASIDCYDLARLHSPRAQNRDPAQVFIVGMPRSGATLAEQIIVAHPATFGAGERPALGQAWHALGGAERAGGGGAYRGARPGGARSRRKELSRRAARARPRCRTDKMPGNFNYLGLVAQMLPGAKIIYCARDPRDIGLSILTFRFYGYHPYAHDLPDLGLYITQHERLMAHWRAVLPNLLMTVRIEDWVGDFTGT